MDSVKQTLLDRLALARDAQRLYVMQSRYLIVRDPPAVAAAPVLALLDQLWEYARHGIVPDDLVKQ
jgi:hypothetical protein